MMNDKLDQLEKRIQSRFCSVEYIENEVSRVKNESPNDLSGSLPKEVIEHKPWNKQYLKELHGRYICGARNEEAILHMGKVSRFVFLKEWVIAGVISTIAIIGIICVIITTIKR